MDIYFLKKYGKLYEKVEEAEFVQYIFENKHGKIVHNFLKRRIPKDICSYNYYDIITPYGYGGPIISESSGDKDVLIEEFSEEFERYCLQNGIISEFVRFHPIFSNHNYFENFYNVEYNRETALTTIILDENNFELSFSKSARKSLRRCLRDGLHYEIIERPNLSDIQLFKDVYESTLERNSAEDYYYFDEDYFEGIINELQDYAIIINIYYEDKVISSALYFIYDKYMHAHLSGTKSEYLNLSPAYLVKYAAIKFAEANNIEYIHHGGGTSGNENDPLLEFKKKFTNKETISFYTGKKVYNKKIYQELIKKTNAENIDYFPQYRGKLNE